MTIGFDDGIRQAEPMPVHDDGIDDTPNPLGPTSLIWKYFGDRRAVLSFQRVAGTENCIEQLAKGVEDHSVIFSDFAGRARRTVPPIMKTIYSENPAVWGRRVRDFHRLIKGTVDSDGSRYHALNPELFYWAHATFVDQVLFTTDTFIRRLSETEKARIFQESKAWYALYGVSDRTQPQTYDEFRVYWDCMLDRFVPTKTITYATGYLRKGVPRPKQVPAPVWRVVGPAVDAALHVVVVGTLPQQMRDVCELQWSDKDERRFQRFAATMRALNPLITRLPLTALYVPWAARAWARSGVDPRGIANRPA